jgi:hypothetical protein
MRQEVDTLHQQIQDQRLHYEGILMNLRDNKSAYEEHQRQRFIQVTEEIERLMQ